MNRGRSRGGRGNYVYVPKARSSSSFGGPSAPSHRPVSNYESSNETMSGEKDGGLKSIGSVSEQSDTLSATDASHESVISSPGFTEASSRMGNLRISDALPASAGSNLDRLESSSLCSNFDADLSSLSGQSNPKEKCMSAKWQHREQTVWGKSNRSNESSNIAYPSIGHVQASHEKTVSSGEFGSSHIFHPGVDSGVKRCQTSHEKAYDSGNSENSQIMQTGGSFDICVVRTGIQLKAPLHVRNKEKRNESKCLMEAQSINELRPGMVHLRRYLSLADQIKIVENCRKLGLGPGGFYQPGYRDGAKLNLKMMCLGKNWDPQTSEYTNERLTDGSRPPAIPNEFSVLVQRAIQDSHAYLKKLSNRTDVQDILPPMKPDLCIVNFYTNSGRLGLHQDKDESQESLRRGLPVVSFSIGDSAEFVYGNQRDIDKAERIVLESGDVLIFGGKSRHVFHGVTNVNPRTAPKSLEEANLRPGRLNLTFRKY